MSALWRQRFLLAQCALALGALGLLYLEYRTLDRLESAEQTLRNRAGAGKAISVERVFAFPEDVCAPKPAPLFPVQKKSTVPAPAPAQDVTALARAQFQYSMVLTSCVLFGLLIGVALAYRAAARETRLAQLKAGFISNISHEMKTPLAAIQMLAETLAAGRVRDSARAGEYHNAIHNESLRLGRMIEDALDFARMEGATREYRFASCDLNHVASETVEQFRKHVEMSGGTLQLQTGELPAVIADSQAIQQALLNLLGNALKYSAAQKTIRVRTFPSRDAVGIEVEDRGIGIEASEKSRIFEQFYRVNSSASEGTKGAGLGLAIVKHIVDAHGGRIEVESKPGEGSRFTMILPQARKKIQPVRMTHGERTAEAAHR
ncbi:MAG: HAMP domain-containing histidine kinase [Candidatus Solibacter usitatus]|nr:HAMP domain-containing histidine kinase [Candidatus Solibacter usitatus]